MASIEEQLTHDGAGPSGTVRRPRRRRFLATEAVVWVLCVTLTSLAFLAVRDALANPPQTSVNGETGLPGADGADPFGGKRNITVLLVGTDQDNRLCDTIIVAFINRQSQRIGLLSIPRDTQVQLTNGEHCKINSVLGFSMGPKDDISKGLIALEASVNKLLGIRLDGYARIDVKAFQQVVDYLGGVEVNVPPGPHGNGLHYEDSEQKLSIHLRPGVQTLKGYDAMCFVRWRKDNCGLEGHASDGTGSGGDQSRMKRQQQFLQAVAAKAAARLKGNKIEATKTAFALAGIACKNMTTNLNLNQIQSVAQMARAVDVAGIDAQSVPIAGSRLDDKIGFVFLVDEAAAHETMRGIVDELARTKPISQMARIEVQNACGASGIAEKCRKQLAQIEFRVVRSGNLTDDSGAAVFGHESTSIRCVPQFTQAAEEIRKSLGLPDVTVLPDLPEAADVDVVIILGRDFAGKSRGH